MTPQEMSPAAGHGDGARDASPRSKQAQHNHSSRKAGKHSLTFLLPPDTVPITVTGWQAQTLAFLIQTGPEGFTSGEASPLGWERRTSAYVQKLREAGVPILTTWETTHDARVGRYTLAGPVVVLSWGVSS